MRETISLTLPDGTTINIPSNLSEFQKALQILDITIDPASLLALQNAFTRHDQSETEARLATQLRTLTPQEAVDYIESNVTNLATAKQVMKIMARMLIAMRDKVFPELPE